eukprot:TRINITY_DN1297_c0_g1_i2.p2 TRINITY_DN1297_c0_g1~~TRINITY_DN1297_c0_g1_i2.p2  ORF type:complete len:160 (-),score=31.03 TRINITY_DN1297_c0_g1_i2:392-871(-)
MVVFILRVACRPLLSPVPFLMRSFACDCPAVQELTRLREKYEAGATEKKVGVNMDVGDSQAAFYQASLDRQRRFRAERNLYLSAFTLTLLFVLGAPRHRPATRLLRTSGWRSSTRFSTASRVRRRVPLPHRGGAPSPAKRKPVVVVPAAPVSAADRKKQ